jgi:hypothetical protein
MKISIYCRFKNLLGIEYCLTKIINELVKTNEELSEADIESLQILTEGFVNNCFKKKIKFFLSNQINLLI